MRRQFELGSQYWTAVILVFLSLAGSSSSAAWQNSLSEAEIQVLSVAATAHFNTSQNNTSQLDTSQRTNKVIPRNTQLGLEVLLIELQEVKNRTTNDSRLAEIFVFDYSTGAASVMLIEVDSQSVIRSRPINDIHLPLNEREVGIATQSLLNDAELMAELALEYEKQVGKPLLSLQQLDMKVSIWNPRSNGHSYTDCNLTRCALVSLFTRNHYNFSVEPVVNLSTSSVILDWVQ